VSDCPHFCLRGRAFEAGLLSVGHRSASTLVCSCLSRADGQDVALFPAFLLNLTRPYPDIVWEIAGTAENRNGVLKCA